MILIGMLTNSPTGLEKIKALSTFGTMDGQ